MAHIKISGVKDISGLCRCNGISAENRGKVLQKARKAKGLEQQDVAEVLGVNKKNISDWETARVKAIPEDKMEKWLELLDVNLTVDFYAVELPVLPLTTYGKGVVRELGNLFLYAVEHIEEDWVAKDGEYNRNVKNDMRELMERYLRERDEQVNK